MDTRQLVGWGLLLLVLVLVLFGIWYIASERRRQRRRENRAFDKAASTKKDE
jgi:hypothetical protein